MRIMSPSRDSQSRHDLTSRIFIFFILVPPRVTYPRYAFAFQSNSSLSVLAPARPLSIVVRRSAYVRVHSLAVCIAACSSSFHLCATSFASGSSGFGAPRSACIERRIVRIWRAGDQLPIHQLILVIEETVNQAVLFSTSKHMRPSLSIFGW